ncbi:angiopoietin-4-like [Physella acuta]|uniref:angiopoietin-4-like n=1 Tax=Physella acuta TaxID=109671 RepID=UPI0027DCD6D3|nr:angiopoietin-4-like [Physella acuta]
MSAVLVTALLVVNIMFTCGLDISLQREYYMEGKDLFCGKLHCLENTREDIEISAFVNMSVYRISELEGKIVLASVSESDSRVRDYKVAGSKVDGKFSKVFGELTVSFTKPSECFSTVFGCDVYYTNRRGLTEMKENKTKPVDQDNRKPLMLMTIEAKTPEFDKTIDRMSEFLKTFIDCDMLNIADLKMNLQFLTDHKHSNLSNHKTELTKEKNDETLVKLTNVMESRLNSVLSAQGSTIQRLEMQINNVVNRMNTLNNTNQEFTHFKYNLTESFLKTIQQIQANNNTLEKQNSTAILERQNISIQQLWESYKNLSETQSKTQKDLITAVSLLNNTKKMNNTIQNLITKSDQIIEYLKCANMNDRVLADMNKAGVDVSRTLCDTKTDGGGWIVIQGYNELRFDMKYKGNDYYAVYRGFKVENEAAKYKMSYTSFSGGNVEDKFSFHKGMKFTTIDSDNDRLSDGNCAVGRGAGWWYEYCHRVNVNGEWASRGYGKGIHWISITGWYDSLDVVEMKLRQM